MNWYLQALKKYAVFSGRSRRSEYWYFFLFNIIASIVAGIIDGITGMGFVVLLYSLAVLIPGIAVTVRRLHDTDRSAWWLLVAFVPFIGALVLLFFMAQAGTQGDNSYGPDPKAV